MDVQFITSIAVITPDPSVSRRLYVHGLGLPLIASEADEYLHSEGIGSSEYLRRLAIDSGRASLFRHP